MRKLPLLFALSFLWACNDSEHTTLENKLLETQLENLKTAFLARVDGDPKAHWPLYDKLQVFDAEFENLIANAESEKDVNNIQRQLEVCKEAVNSVNWPLTALQNSVSDELDYILANLGELNGTMLKQRLQLIQLLYWNGFSNVYLQYQYSVDTVGTYVANHNGVHSEPFSTPIVAVAYYTAENYSVIVGDSISEKGVLLGKKRELKHNDERISVFVDSTPEPGNHRIPAQLIAMSLRGTMDTMNFYIDYHIK